MRRTSIYIILLIVFAFNISKANIEIDTSINPIIIKGIVIDSILKSPLVKTTILVNKIIVGNTNEDGVFEINLSIIDSLEINEMTKVKIAYTGYRIKIFTVKELESQKVIELDDVIICDIKPTKWQRFKNWIRNLFR